jgi:lysophospholipase L1-like esterase
MRYLLALLATILLSPLLSAAVVVPADDSGILYTGRWDRTNPSEPWAYAKGTSVQAKFNGTSLYAILSATTNDYIRINIIEDDAVVRSEKIPIAYGTDSYELATGLEDKTHKIEIVKETAFGRWTFLGFELEDGKTLDPDPPARPGRKLVFYGDSNLAGDSLEHEQNNGARSLQGSYFGYAGISSRMLGAEYSNISRSGASIRSLHTSFDRIDWGSPGTDWDFEQGQPPDAVIINIGANDVGRPKSKMIKDYHSLLDDMRSVYPDAHIMLFNAWGWDYAEPANFINEVIEERNDDNMSWAIFPWLFEQWHGCEYDHSGMAHVLVQHLVTVMRWEEEVKDADVMNGYGAGGNVANGGFEEVAPFGGYGWRYFTDDGVARMEEVAPRTGQYFLRLENGASVHQPNPAMGGDTFTVTAWVRGNIGDSLFVTIDFRDQNMWTDPLHSTTEEFEMTGPEPGWKEISITGTAPVGGSKPVFHTRLTFQAGSGSIIDIDDVKMQLVADVCIDDDEDGYGDPGSLLCTVGSAKDCDDDNNAMSPGKIEICNGGIDEDCDGFVDDDDSDCSTQACMEVGDACTTNSDCCSNSCSKGKPSSRVCRP